MKVQNLKFQVLFLIIGSFFTLLSGCSSSDDGDKDKVIDQSKLIGKWELFRYLDSTGEEGEGLHTHFCGNKDYWKFETNTSQSIYSSKSWDPECTSYTASGTWSLVDNQLSIVAQDEFESFNVTYEITELTDTKLVVKENFGNGEYWQTELKKAN